MTRVCTACGETSPADANWCEACGGDLDAVPAVPKTPCVSCNAAAADITDDGWCQQCGHKQPAPEDHVVADHGWFAIVSDRGRVHRTNEDAGAVAARPGGVALVVCDGVSSTDESQHASQNAARTVIGVVESARNDSIERALVDAAVAAQREIVEVTASSSTEPPSCTMVAAVADIEGAVAQLTIGWLGDSRAYWLGDADATQLTRDHSWAMEQRDLGELDPATIDADPRASSITRWLGADSQDTTPQITRAEVDLPGTLLVCSDGLWNYARTEAELHELVTAAGADEAPLERAERLVAFANAQGGHDNITVAVAHLTPRSADRPPRPDAGDTNVPDSQEPTITGEPQE